MSVVTFLAFAIKFSTVFLFGATGETINQKSGHLNMGTPGIMYLGAMGGIIGERLYISSVANPNSFLIVLIPVLFAIVFGAIGGIIFSFFTVTLHCNQNVTGLTLTTLGVGIACLYIGSLSLEEDGAMARVGQSIQSAFPWHSNLGWFGDIFLSQSWFTYLGIIIAIVAAIVINKTKVGLNLRAVGENAAAADSAGINVNAYRYIATIIGSSIAAIGGAFYELDQAKGAFNVADSIDKFGWLALCIVIFSMWRPIITIFASFGFACLTFLPIATAPFLGKVGYVTHILELLPYVATLLVLIATSIVNSKRMQAPANLGVSYFREDR